MYQAQDGSHHRDQFDLIRHESQTNKDNKKRQDQKDRTEQGTQRQQQKIRNLQIEALRRQNFYDRQQEHEAVFGRPFGTGQGRPARVGSQPSPNVRAGGQPTTGAPTLTGKQGNQGGYGMPTERKETVIDPLIQDAGRLSDMLNQEYRHQRGIAEPKADGPDDLLNARAERRGGGGGGGGGSNIGKLTEFINNHSGISHSGVTGVQFEDGDRDNDPLVSFLGEGGDPVKQFYLSALSNLNNYAGQKQQKYNPGRQVKEPEQQMQQLQAMAQQLAQQELAGETQSVRNKNMPAEIQHQFQQLMKQYGPANPGWEDTGFSQPNQTPGFNVFDNRQQGQESGDDYLAYLQKMLGGGGQQEAPPPPGGPVNATPKQGGTSPAARQMQGWGNWGGRGLLGQYGR